MVPANGTRATAIQGSGKGCGSSTDGIMSRVIG